MRHKMYIAKQKERDLGNVHRAGGAFADYKRCLWSFVKMIDELLTGKTLDFQQKKYIQI